MKLIAEEVAILLARMDTHPEEFIEDLNWGEFKWKPFLPRGHGFNQFNILEQYLVRKKYRRTIDTFEKKRAYAEIMKRLIDPPKEKEVRVRKARRPEILEEELETQRQLFQKLHEQHQKEGIGKIVC